MSTAHQIAPAPPETLSLREAAAWAGRSKRTLRRWLAAGHLRELRVQGARGEEIRVRTAELRAYLASLRQDAPPPRAPVRPGDNAPVALVTTPRLAAVPAPVAPVASPSPSAEPPGALVEALRERIAGLEGDKARLCAEVDAARELHRLEVAELRAEVAALREDLAGERQARAAVEREAARQAAEAAKRPAGGVRGLLGRWLG